MKLSVDENIYRQHVVVLTAGFFVGILAAYLFMSIEFDLSHTVAAALEQGVVSRTNLDGYPKQRDIINYVAVVGFPVLFGIGGWLVWSRGERHNKLISLMRQQPSRQTGVGWKLICVVSVVYAAASIWSYCSPVYDNLSSVLPWYFLGEEGQNLAWAQSIMAGGVYGRDSHCLYGPMLIYPLVGFMKLVGTTVSALRSYTFALNLTAYTIVIAFLCRTIRGKMPFVLASVVYLWTLHPLVVLFPNASYLRVMLGMLPVLLMYEYLENRKTIFLAATGLILGQSLLFSQEVGICSAIAIALAFLLMRFSKGGGWAALREAGVVLACCAASIAPMTVYFLVKGALGEILPNLLAHPRLLSLGYQTLAFPDIRVFVQSPFSGVALILYCTILVYIASALHLVPLLIMGRRDRDILLRTALLVFGGLLFRVALARSDAFHAIYVLPPALFLLFLSIDDVAMGVSTATPAIRKISGGIVLLLFSLFVVFVTVRETPVKLFEMAFLGGAVQPAIPRMDVTTSPDLAKSLEAIYHFLESNTNKEDYVFFFPTEAAMYFIFDRRVPTRYAHAMHAGTTQMRYELIADLESKRPEYVIYNARPIEIDDIKVSVYLPEIDSYIYNNYVQVGRHKEYLFMRRKS